MLALKNLKNLMRWCKRSCYPLVRNVKWWPPFTF